MKTTVIGIDGMHSAEDMRLVANAIQDLPCLGHVEISLESGEATVEHSSMVSEDDIRQAIEAAGFTPL